MKKFLLLLGASGVGKSTLIQELEKLDSRFVYVSPYITRPLRKGEVEKVSVSRDAFNEMENTGKFISVNDLYGVRYGTPYEPIIDAVQRGKFPILDYPISDLETIRGKLPGLVFAVYVFPPSVEVLRERMIGREERFEESRREVESVRHDSPDIEFSVINHEGETRKVAEGIYRRFLEQET